MNPRPTLTLTLTLTLSPLTSQVNIGQNNNKYYVIQLMGDYYLFTRWDRVGGPGQMQLKGPMTRSQAQKSFNGMVRASTAW